MSWVTRAPEVARDLGREMMRVVPRTVAGLNESTGWVPTSPRGVRQFGEVMLDELVLTGFSVLGGNLAALRPLSECAAAAAELSALGIDRAHRDPEPLWVSSIRRQRVGGLAYERMTFAHDPALPSTLAAEGLGEPARAVVHLCRHREGPRPWLVWVHGAGQGGPEDLLLSRIGTIFGRMGFNVALPIQPGHGSRRRHVAAVSGHGSAGQRRGHDAGGVGGSCRRAMGAAAGHCRCGSRDFDGNPGGGAGFAL